jgi:hypothetical protein
MELQIQHSDVVVINIRGWTGMKSRGNTFIQ